MPKRAFFTEREFSRLQFNHAERWQSGNAADC